MTPRTSSALTQLDEAAAAGKLSAGAVKNVRLWLSDDRYADYADQVAEHIEQEKWQQLDDVFWTVIPFGTGGRRGRMYPIGCNAINDRTIGESAQGLADYVNERHQGDAPPACAIAYDTRHRSRQFAELCAEVMVAAGIKVYFLDGYRATPELSFCVRHKNCACGIMVTASHNPPSDNAVKAYWSSGAQLLPPHDKAVIDRVMQVQQIRRSPFDEALAAGQVEFCQDEIDPAFIAAVNEQRFDGPRDLKIIYSPLHGVGASAVCPALEGDGFTDVELFQPHAEPDGDFPNVPGHVSNPENPAVFDAIIERAQETGADLILASDPDCDRIGAAAALTTDEGSDWATFSGNQIGALLADWVLSQRQAAGSLGSEHYLVKTLVTSEMIRRIGDGYGVRTFGDLLVGFKWIGGLIDEQGPERFVLGLEESHGYLVGQYARDKDAAVAAMLLAELAAAVKAEGQTLHQKLDALYWQFGYHGERLFTQAMPGSAGMQRMKAVMAAFRARPPEQLAGLSVSCVRDYLAQTATAPGASPEPLAGPQGDMIILDLAAEGNSIAVRPSGTEPKVKFYMFTYEPAELMADLDDTRDEMSRRLENLHRDLAAFVESA